LELKADNKTLTLIGSYKKQILAVGVALVLIILTIVVLQISNQRTQEAQKEAYLAGSQAYSKGEFDQAIKDLETAKKLNPQDAKTHINLAQSYEAKGKLDEALAEYEASLKINPNQPEARYNLAIIYKSQNKLDDAIKELGAVLKLDKNFVAAQIALGDIYAQKGDINKAKEHYQAVLKLNPFGVDLAAIKAKLDALK
jgi:tetratricopeptide (TPR) repeat protein